MTSRDRRLIVETMMVMAAVRMILRRSSLRNLRRILGWYARASSGSRQPDPAYLHRIQWAVAAAAVRVPGSTCLVQSLTAEVLLQRRGFVPELCLGVRRGAPTGSFEAHAWVQCGDRVVVGAVDDRPDFTVLSRLRA